MPPERILSQQEIDDLLRDLASRPREGAGETGAAVPVSGDEVLAYDFRRPSKFSRDQLRSLERIHQQFGRLLGIMLGVRLRTEVSVRVVSVQQLTYGEFIRSVPNPSLLAVIQFGQGGDRIVMELSLELAMHVYERLAGGTGPSRIAGREPTDIELHVLRKQLLGLTADAYRQAWSSLVELPMAFQDLETNPTYLNLVLDQDTVMWIALEVEIREVSDRLNICLPHSALEPLLPRLAHEFMLRIPARSRAGERERLERLLKDTVVSVQAILGRVDLEVRELMDLRIGDVLVLGTGIHDEVRMYVADRPKFAGRIGRIGSRLAVRLTGPASEAVAAEPEPDALQEAPVPPDGRVGAAPGGKQVATHDDAGAR